MNTVDNYNVYDAVIVRDLNLIRRVNTENTKLLFDSVVSVFNLCSPRSLRHPHLNEPRTSAATTPQVQARPAAGWAVRVAPELTGLAWVQAD